MTQRRRYFVLLSVLGILLCFAIIMQLDSRSQLVQKLERQWQQFNHLQWQIEQFATLQGPEKAHIKVFTGIPTAQSWLQQHFLQYLGKSNAATKLVVSPTNNLEMRFNDMRYDLLIQMLKHMTEFTNIRVQTASFKKTAQANKVNGKVILQLTGKHKAVQND